MSSLTRKDFQSNQEVRWCPGCGDYAILAAVQKTLPKIGVEPHNTVFVSGIGCASRFPYYMSTYGFHTIHGRAFPVATGLKTTNPDLSVWVITGDGDGLSIGIGHLLHLIRRNIDVNILLFNNEIYGLTKGQKSPTSRIGTISKTSPEGSTEHPIDAIKMAMSVHCGFVARSYDTDKELPNILQQAAEHKGTSFIEIYQNCNVFNDGVFEDIHNKRFIRLEDKKPLAFNEKYLTLNNLSIDFTDNEKEAIIYDAANYNLANMLLNLDENFPIPIGVFYQKEKEISKKREHANKLEHLKKQIFKGCWSI